MENTQHGNVVRNLAEKADGCNQMKKRTDRTERRKFVERKASDLKNEKFEKRKIKPDKRNRTTKLKTKILRRKTDQIKT